MKKKNYSIIEHTSDIGIAVEAPDCAGIFVNSAEAMFDIMAERRHANVRDTPGIRLDVRLTAEDIKRYRQNKEFKAATYHRLELVNGPDVYKAKVIFDV